jgi:hypothetical protein
MGWFIGKIRMRLAAGGTPAAVKRRAVNSSNELKSSLYISNIYYIVSRQNAELQGVP